MKILQHEVNFYHIICMPYIIFEKNSGIILPEHFQLVVSLIEGRSKKMVLLRSVND